MISKKELRELAADILREMSKAAEEGDNEKVRHLENAYDKVVKLLAEMEEESACGDNS
jgi:polyhydroxyalkanoate synthesis regulator phasin